MSNERYRTYWEAELVQQKDTLAYVAEDDPSSIVGFAAGGRERTDDPNYGG